MSSGTSAAEEDAEGVGQSFDASVSPRQNRNMGQNESMEQTGKNNGVNCGKALFFGLIENIEPQGSETAGDPDTGNK